MLIGDISRAELRSRLHGAGVHLVTGAFTIHVRAELRHFVDEFAEMYADFTVEEPPGIDDASVRVAAASGWRWRSGAQAMAWIANEPAFGPVPADLAYTVFETALNWCIALSDVAPMFLHAAVLERDGRALILPAPSASGKSTLCAALAWRGWRLFSDEMAIFDFDSGDLRPNPRPVSLKNAAIDVVRAIEPRASISRTYRGTPKGDVAYMRPPATAVTRALETAAPSLVVTPKYVAGAPTEIVRLQGREAFELLTANSVNYATMLRWGFDRIVGTVERCIVCRMTYSDLDAATVALDRLHREAMARSAPS